MRDPQEYLRHPNGRGRILDDAEVFISAHLSKESTAAQQCQLQDCFVKGKSYVAENARVFGGHINNSYIGGDVVIAGYPSIINSIVRGKSVSGEASLKYCNVFKHGEVSGAAQIIGESIDHTVVITDNALVYGTAMLVGHFEVKGRMRINSGVWKRAPRHVDLGFVAITESKTGALVDCRDRHASYWFKHGPKLGERWGWNSKEIAAAMIAVKFVSTGEI